MKEGEEVLQSFCQAHMRQRSDIDLLQPSLDAFFARGACGRYALSPEGRVPEDMLLHCIPYGRVADDQNSLLTIVE